MNKSLSYFMREEKERIVEVPAPESFVDENGNRIMMQVRTLSSDRIREITSMYRRREIAFDKNGKPYSEGGEVLYKTENDMNKAFRHVIAEALVYPDLTDKDIMAHYNCYDKAELVLKVFSRNGEYDSVFRNVMTALGIIGDKDDEELTDEAKN